MRCQVSAAHSRCEPNLGGTRTSPPNQFEPNVMLKGGSTSYKGATAQKVFDFQLINLGLLLQSQNANGLEYAPATVAVLLFDWSTVSYGMLSISSRREPLLCAQGTHMIFTRADLGSACVEPDPATGDTVASGALSCCLPSCCSISWHLAGLAACMQDISQQTVNEWFQRTL